MFTTVTVFIVSIGTTGTALAFGIVIGPQNGATYATGICGTTASTDDGIRITIVAIGGCTKSGGISTVSTAATATGSGFR